MVDLFSGCGGFSLGAELAGFRSLAAIDIDPTLQSAYRRNFPNSRAIQASVAELQAADWRQLIGNQRPDLVIGGPPCQGFSFIGKRQKDDPRNTLIHHFYRQVSILRPKVFIMENVEGLLSEENRDVLSSAIETVAGTYTVLKPMLVNAADYGAATARKRVVVIGYDPAELGDLSHETFAPAALAKRATVRDAISDLPNPVPEIKDDFGWQKYPKRRVEELSAYASQLRACAPNGLGSAEYNERHKGGAVSGMNLTRHRADIARRYAAVPAGKSDPITKSYKLDWNGQSPTIRAGTGADKGAFQAVRPLHPKLGRVITVREAARLQGFPDWFTFHPTKWHSFRMIGNSVSPFVSNALMARLAERLHVALAA
jgi:DNA (cytosine-5)-methyltransferase 1